MRYQQGSLGRVFLVKLEHGDDMLQEIKRLALETGLKSAYLFMIGALESTTMVVGPQECVLPPQGLPVRLEDGREIVAMGTLFTDQDSDEPVLHIHGSLGRGNTSFTGCLRADSQVFLVVEMLIIELLGFEATKGYDPLTKMKTLLLNQADSR